MIGPYSLVIPLTLQPNYLKNGQKKGGRSSELHPCSYSLSEADQLPPRGLPPERPPPLLERDAPELLNEELLREPEKLLLELEDLGLENELLVELELLKPRELAGL